MHECPVALALLFRFLLPATLQYRLLLSREIYCDFCEGQYMVEVLYKGRHVTGSPFHQNIVDPTQVKLESARKFGFVGDEMSLDSKYFYSTNYYNNNGFICIVARMLDYTISATQYSAYNITQIIKT